MLKAITNNPYRLLGVYSNSPKKEQIANKGKMQAFLRVKKTMPFPLDLKGILPEVSRTQEAIDAADSELALSSGQIKHAQFWFVNKTPVDGIAFNHLLGGNIDSAIEMWRKATNMSSLQNLFVCFLIKQDYKTAIVDYAIPLYNSYADSFVSMIDENASLSISELAENIIEVLSSEDVNTTYISNFISDPVWKGHIEAKRVNPLLSQLESHLSEAKSSKGKGPAARLNAGHKLKIASKPLLTTLRSLLQDDDTRYQMIADKVTQEVLQCSIDYYNDSSDLDSPAKALPLCEYAKSIASGTAAKQRCNENYDVIKNAFDNMPPVEVSKEAKEIDELFGWYRKQNRTSANGLELLRKAQKPLITIKEKLGKNNKYYLETSSTLGSAALSNVIDEVNDVQKEDEPNPLSGLFGGSRYSLFENALLEQERRRNKAYSLKSALRDAWKTILYINLLDITDAFNKRYQANRKTLKSIIDSVQGFSYPDDSHIIRGCAYNISAERSFFWSESEHFAACKYKSDYEKYLSNFPSGKHVDEANTRIEEIKAHDRKVLLFSLIAAAIFILLIIWAISANAKNTVAESSSEASSIENVATGSSDNSAEGTTTENSFYSTSDGSEIAPDESGVQDTESDINEEFEEDNDLSSDEIIDEEEEENYEY